MGDRGDDTDFEQSVLTPPHRYFAIRPLITSSPHRNAGGHDIHKIFIFLQVPDSFDGTCSSSDSSSPCSAICASTTVLGPAGRPSDALLAATVSELVQSSLSWFPCADVHRLDMREAWRPETFRRTFEVPLLVISTLRARDGRQEQEGRDSTHVTTTGVF